jgi:Ulp1 family protease
MSTQEDNRISKVSSTVPSSTTSSYVVCELQNGTITKLDFDLIQQKNSWLNDNLITFYIEWLLLQQENDEVLIFHPGACFMLRLLPISELLESGNKEQNIYYQAKSSPNVKFILLPINNSSGEDAFGSGTHWSLLVIDKSRKLSLHFDSSFNVNRNPAIETMKCMELLLGFQLKFENVMNCYQQRNGYDCGLILLLNLRKFAVSKRFGQDIIGDESALKLRKELFDLIMEQVKKRQRGQVKSEDG